MSGDIVNISEACCVAIYHSSYSYPFTTTIHTPTNHFSYHLTSIKG